MSGSVFDKTTQPIPENLYTPPTPEYFPGITAQNMVPFNMGPGMGVSQFLTGQMGIPMQFNVDVPSYERMNLTPGDFAKFMKVQSQGTAKKPVIPVFNPVTGDYDKYGGDTKKSSLFSSGGQDSNILGYTATGAPIYSSPPSSNVFSFFGSNSGN